MRLMLSLRIFSILNKSSSSITRKCGLISQDLYAQKMNTLAWNFSSCFHQFDKRLLNGKATITISFRCKSNETKDIGKKKVEKQGPKKLDVNTTDKKLEMVNLFSSEDLFIGKRTLADARDYAKKENLQLVKLQGKNTNIEHSYKLVTSNTFKELGKKEKQKTDKTFVIKGNIEENDLLIKTNKIIKYLEKGRPVVVKIMKNPSAGKSTDPFGHVLKRIGEKLDHIAYVQSSTTTNDVCQSVFIPRENLTQKDS